MKIAILGNVNNPVTNKPNDPYSWFVKTYIDGLQHNGINPLLINYKSLNLGQIREILISNKIDFCFTHLTFHGFKDTFQEFDMYRKVTKQVGTRFIHTCGDAKTHDRYMQDISNVFFAAFVGTKVLVKNAEPVWKIPVYYSPYSSLVYEEMGNYEPSLDFKMPVFTGSPTAHKDRKKFIEELIKIMPIKIITTQSSGDLRNKTLDLSASSIILGLCTGYEIEGFFDVRPFQYLGAGACMIMRKFPGMDEIIPDNLYYSFDSYDNPNIVKEHWENMQEIDVIRMRRKAFKFMQEHHSSKIRIKQVLDILKES